MPRMSSCSSPVRLRHVIYSNVPIMVRLTPSDALLSTIKEYNNLPASCRGDIINTEALLSIDHQTIQKISESLLESVNVPRDGSHNLGRDGASLEHYRLHYLLRGCAVYIPPKPPKQEQVCLALLAFSALVGKLDSKERSAVS